MRSDGRPDHIQDALIKMNTGQWFTWTDSSNKIYANLRLTEKVGIDGNIVDNPVTQLPTEAQVNAKLKELQDAWDRKCLNLAIVILKNKSVNVENAKAICNRSRY